MSGKIRLSVGLRRQINNKNTVLSDQQQKRTLGTVTNYMRMVHLWRFFFTSFIFFSLTSYFQADLFGPWGGGCDRTLRTPPAYAPAGTAALTTCLDLVRFVIQIQAVWQMRCKVCLNASFLLVKGIPTLRAEISFVSFFVWRYERSLLAGLRNRVLQHDKVLLFDQIAG